MDAPTLIRRARRRAGLTQAQLATRAGTSQPVISAYEHGRRDPSTATLGRLLAAAGARLELALAPEEPDLPPPATSEERVGRLLDVLALADAIPHRRRAATLDMPRMVSTDDD